MKTRKLGKDGPEVSAIGLGAMSIGGFFGPTDEPTSIRLLDACRDAGITHLDTADVYGNGLSEEVIGRYLARNPGAFTLATKGGIAGGIAPGVGRGFDNSRDYLQKALDASLRRLGTEHVDLYYIHRRNPDVPIEDLAGTMAVAIASGKIGGWGLSEVSPTTLRRAHLECPVTAVQSEYSLWTRSPELGLIQECARLGVAFVPFSPLARGMFADNPVRLEDIAEGEFRLNVPRFQEPNYSDNLREIAKLQDFAQARGWTTAACALAWVLDQGEHLIPIPGTRTAEHLADWATADQIAFSDEDRAELDRLLPIGWAWGDRYSAVQWTAPEKYS